MSVRVKICGITRRKDALSAAKLGADAIGFVFWAKSTRAVSPEAACKIIKALPPFITTVGVYVDPTLAWVEKTAAIAGLDLLQFHGEESPEFCNQFSKPYIKAIRIRDGLDLLQCAKRFSHAKGLLLDTYTAGMPGGTGHVFDWSLIPQALPMPIILSGGLTADNVAAGIKQIQPSAVDVSSGVETSKGIKNKDKISAFIEGVRNSEEL